MEIQLAVQPTCAAAPQLRRDLSSAMRSLGIPVDSPVKLHSDPSVTIPLLSINGNPVRPCLPEHGRISCPACLTVHNLPDREIIRWHLAQALQRRTVLFICSGNAVRSQLAEALTNHFLAGKWAAFSGGIFPMPLWKPVVRALHEIGIDVSRRKPKHIELFLGCRFDMIISLSSYADAFCTAFPGQSMRKHIPFDDPITNPFFGVGDLDRTRKLRDDMKLAVLPYLEGLP